MFCRFLARLLWPVVLLTAGCASIPPEAPALSTELGQRIHAIEQSHLTLLQRYFDQKRHAVDRFIEEEWVPEFARQFFANEGIAGAWDQIVREGDESARLDFLVRLGPKLQQAIQQKRRELIQPLDTLERRIGARLTQGYEQARAINNSLTSFLHSAAKVADNRERYLAMAGGSRDQVDDWIEQTDEAVSTLVDGASKVSDRADRAATYLEKARAIRDSME